jgi:hypothetical protein
VASLHYTHDFFGIRGHCAQRFVADKPAAAEIVAAEVASHNCHTTDHGRPEDLWLGNSSSCWIIMGHAKESLRGEGLAAVLNKVDVFVLAEMPAAYYGSVLAM